jgi:hypothetical protein
MLNTRPRSRGGRDRLRTDRDRIDADRRRQPVGGSGAIFGAVIGCIVVYQQIVIGVIVLAVAVDTFAKSRRRRI